MVTGEVILEGSVTVIEFIEKNLIWPVRGPADIEITTSRFKIERILRLLDHQGHESVHLSGPDFEHH
jgi:hypothetical protein